MDGDQPASSSLPQQREETPTSQPRGRRGSSSICNNTMEYIIKHCFKKMLDEDFREEVQPICDQHHLSYSVFTAFWRQRYAPNKYIGLTKFMKMIGDVHPAVSICRLFFTSYLWQEYPRLIAVGSMRNK